MAAVELALLVAGEVALLVAEEPALFLILAVDLTLVKKIYIDLKSWLNFESEWQLIAPVWPILVSRCA